MFRRNLALIVNPAAQRATSKTEDIFRGSRKSSLYLVPRVKPIKALPGGRILIWLAIGSFVLLTVGQAAVALGILAVPVLGWLGLL